MKQSRSLGLSSPHQLMILQTDVSYFSVLFSRQSALLNSRSLESPNNSNEVLSEVQIGVSRLQDDSDVEEDTELPPLESIIPKDILKKLKPKEKKRQDVINGNLHSHFFSGVNRRCLRSYN